MALGVFNQSVGYAVIDDVTYNAVPEPLTIFGAGTALGFGAFFKRKTKQAQSKRKIETES